MNWRARIVGLVLFSAAGCVVKSHDCLTSASAPVTSIDAREEFLGACAPCHGVDARGGGPVASALKVLPPDITRLAERTGGRFPRDEVIAVMSGDLHVAAHGSREMPIWSQRFGPGASGGTVAASMYARRWLEALVSYLESIQHPAVTS